MTLFITGSESFIGRVLRDQCRARGIETIGIDTVAPNDSVSKKGNICDPAIGEMIPEGATVIHLAAVSRDADCRENPRRAFDVNITGTLNVAAAAEKRRAKQLIFASSEWVYGDVRNDEVQFEDQPIDVTSMKSEYALSKIVGEQLLRLTCKVPAVTVLRFGIVYGSRTLNWSAVESLFNTVRTGDEVRIGSVETARRFIHVSDIASGILASCGRAGFEVFNLSGDRPLTLREVIATSAKLLGRRVTITETNPQAPSIRNPDNTKARTMLDWKPEIDLESGLTDLSLFLDSRMPTGVNP